MATTEKPDGKRSGGPSSESVRSGCPDGSGKAESTPRLLQHLLRTDVCPGYQLRDQVGVGRIKDFSPNSVCSRFVACSRTDARRASVGRRRPLCFQSKATSSSETRNEIIFSRSRLKAEFIVAIPYGQRTVPRSSLR